MNSKYNRSHIIDFIFPITLLLIFAVSALAVALFAADIYKQNVTNSSRNDSSKILLSYVTEKVHAGDKDGNVHIGTFDGNNALIIDENINGEKYSTYIYSYKNNLCELFVKADNMKSSNFDSSNGTAIIEANNFQIAQLDDNLIIFSCTDSNNDTITQIVATRSK